MESPTGFEGSAANDPTWGGQDEPNAHAPPRVGPYVVLRALGRGGQGTVYLAEDPRLSRRVALKVLEGFDPGGGDAAERLRREAAATSSLRHPGICAVFEARIDERPPYIAMQYVAGETLAARLATVKNRLSTTATGGTAPTQNEQIEFVTNAATTPEPAPPVADAAAVAPDRLPAAEVSAFVRIAEAAARALHAAHEAGVIHRDVKPGNIMIGEDGAPVILDFGLARREESDAVSLTRAGELCGTPAYMSPEQLERASVRVDARTDVWSLGATLYECLALRRPFEGPTREALFRDILSHDPPPLRRVCPVASRDLEAVVMTALAKERDRRYQTALDFAEDLRRVAADEPVRARRAGPLARIALFARREPARAALFATLLVTLPVLAALGTSIAKDRPAAEAARRSAAEEERQATLADASNEISEGDPEKGRAIFVALAAAGDSPEAAAGLVFADMRLGRVEAATAAFDAARPLLGAGAASALLRADVLRMRGDRDAAAAVERDAPEAKELLDHVLLAQRALIRGESRLAEPGEGREEFSRAVAHATRALLLAPRPRLDLHVLRAHAAGHLLDREAASSSARALRRHWPLRRASHYWAAFALTGAQEADSRKVDVRQLDEAVDAAREAARLAPEHAGTLVNLGAAFAARGLYEAAAASYREAAARAPDEPIAWHNLGIALGDLGRPEESIAALTTAARLDRKGIESHLKLGEALEAAGRSEEAAPPLEEAVRRRPEAFQPRFVLGSAYQSLGRTDDAVDAFRAAADVAPAELTGETWCNYGASLESARRHAEALDAFRRGHAAGSRRPDWPYPSAEWIARAEAAAAAQAAEIAEAARLFDAGTPPDEPSDQLRLARALLDAGRPADAARWFDAAFAEEPSLGDDLRSRWLTDAARASASAGDPARAVERLATDVAGLRALMAAGGVPADMVVYVLRKVRHTHAFAPLFADPPPDAAEPWRPAAAAHLAAHKALDAAARSKAEVGR